MAAEPAVGIGTRGRTGSLATTRDTIAAAMSEPTRITKPRGQYAMSTFHAALRRLLRYSRCAGQRRPSTGRLDARPSSIPSLGGQALPAEAGDLDPRKT